MSDLQEFVGLAFMCAGTIVIIMAIWIREMPAEAFIDDEVGYWMDLPPMQPFSVQNAEFAWPDLFESSPT